MVERTKDNEDLVLERLFASDPIADDGFSARVVGRVRRRLWMRRLALPTAAVLGALIAVEPAMSVIAALGSVASVVPIDGVTLPSLQFVPQLTVWLVVTAATIGGLVLLPTLDD